MTSDAGETQHPPQVSWQVELSFLGDTCRGVSLGAVVQTEREVQYSAAIQTQTQRCMKSSSEQCAGKY